MASIRALTITTLLACFACGSIFAATAEAQFAQGLKFAAEGNTSAALEVFTRLTRDYPRLAEPYEQLAALHVRAGNLEKALPALQAALRLRNDDAKLHELLGDIYTRLAATAYRAAVESQPAGNSRARDKYRTLEQAGAPLPTNR